MVKPAAQVSGASALQAALQATRRDQQLWLNSTAHRAVPRMIVLDANASVGVCVCACGWLVAPCVCWK